MSSKSTQGRGGDRPLVQWTFLQLRKVNKQLNPVPCFLQSETQIGSKMLIYGGCNYNGDALDQLFIYDTAGYQWSAPQESSDYQEDTPAARYGHTATLIEMHPPKIMIYGGTIGASTFEFDTPDSLDTPSSNQSSLSKKFLHRKRKGRSKTDEMGELDDGVYFLSLNAEQWTWNKPIGSHRALKPAPRTEHTACKIGTNDVAVFGGWTEAPTNELWIYNYVDNEWTEGVSSGIQPRPRYRHTAEVIGGRMFVFGGSDNGEDVCDGARHLAVHELNLGTMQWTHPELRGGNPFPRSGHGSAVIGAHSVAIFGGKRAEEVFLNDIVILDMETYACTTVNAVENALPTAVGNCSLIAVGNKCIAFGGTDSKAQCYNDVRMLDVSDYLDAADITVGQGASSDYSFKVLIIGDASVGKSALLTRFSENMFMQHYTSTIGIDFNSRMIRVDKAICKLEIWDTAGQERFSTMTANYYRGAQGALIVYDVSFRASFEHAKMWFERAKQLGGADMEAILVGNKSDILDDDRQVSREEGELLAQELDVYFIETSALSGANVESSFVAMTSRIKKSVDRRGLTGVKSSSLQRAGKVTLADGDRKMTLSEKCCS